MDDGHQALMLIATTLFFAFLIERLTEIVMALFEYGEVRFGWYRFWQRRAARIAQTLAQPRDAAWQQEIQRALERYLSREANGVTAVAVAQVRRVYLQVVTKVLSVVVGIILAWLFDLNLFAAIDQLNNAATEQASPYFSAQLLPHGLALVLTGLVLGLGAGPLHKVISALDRARKNNKEAA
ncbi:hypothetical protein CHH28_10805 [Bacterioplanes sanyensis]|uniref:Uncharacterized protein n=1 Tax=Bacterioplanes sanyensis TaxID=1249553 RepID=A0A222FK64_9GAMM|nr:hypothetical protein [Bacterioplanes sanyensis]ASP39139.1 hypothetical protein CHH28_10805 [Bacterioplanes sanyensis]